MYLTFFLHSKDSIFIRSFVKIHPLHLHTFSLQVLMDIAHLLQTWSLNHSPRDTTREIDVNSISILCQYAGNKILTGFHVVFTYFFDEILMGEKSTSFLQTFVEVILMSWKSSSFRRTWFNVNSMCEKLTSFWRTLFNLISMGEISTSFRCTLFNLISKGERSTSFRCTFFYLILMGN